jgi:hypothetical protein
MLTKLPYTVDMVLIKSAVDQLPTIDYKKTINQPTGDFFYEPWVIKEEFRGTVWEEILSTLPAPIGEARLISLGYGNNYQSHADIDDRYHLNIQGNQSYLIDLDSKTMHQTLADGYWYEMNAGRLHSAANFGEVNRIQLVVRKLLSRHSINNSKNIKIICIKEDLARYSFDNKVSSWLNRNNKEGLITDFVFKDTVVEFKAEEQIVSDLENILPEQFRLEIS